MSGFQPVILRIIKGHLGDCRSTFPAKDFDIKHAACFSQTAFHITKRKPLADTKSSLPDVT